MVIKLFIITLCLSLAMSDRLPAYFDFLSLDNLDIKFTHQDNSITITSIDKFSLTGYDHSDYILFAWMNYIAEGKLPASSQVQIAVIIIYNFRSVMRE
jgi:hypothetical protein